MWRGVRDGVGFQLRNSWIKGNYDYDLDSNHTDVGG
jgi:hypothetical protein